VSDTDVSYVVGRAVPAPQVSSSTQAFDKKADITGTFTDCTYGSLTSSSITKVVVLTYEALSAPVPATDEKADLREARDGGSFKVTRYLGLGHPAWLFRSTLAGGPEELTVIKDGQYLAGAAVFSSLSKVKLAALTNLAEKAYFPLTPETPSQPEPSLTTKIMPGNYRVIGAVPSLLPRFGKLALRNLRFRSPTRQCSSLVKALARKHRS
jgi:hypothetical protein